jgi:exodeoxyribonuclease V
MTIEFNEGQARAIDLIAQWFGDYVMGRTRKQVFFLAGSAGTGKTSTARAAAARCVGGETMLYRALFIAPTGKAASRLRQKGCAGAKTLHQFVYRVLGEDEEGDPTFVEKHKRDERPSLVVLDEGSMVGRFDFEALLKIGIPVLVLGDLKQLEPVKAPHYLTPDHVDYELTEIMRQAGESNIIRAAGFVAQGKRLPWREYDDVQVRPGLPPLDQMLEHVDEQSQILCSRNDTRVMVNDKIRAALGFEGPQPQVGEKVMCWFNQHGKRFMNGEQGIVLGYRELESHEREELKEDAPSTLILMQLRSLTDGVERSVYFNPLSFSDDEETRKEAIKAPGGFQFGYCCTIHKSQGSEWDRILMIEEPMGNSSKLFYTGYTRAAKNLRVYRP